MASEKESVLVAQFSSEACNSALTPYIYWSVILNGETKVYNTKELTKVNRIYVDLKWACCMNLGFNENFYSSLLGHTFKNLQRSWQCFIAVQ